MSAAARSDDESTLPTPPPPWTAQQLEQIRGFITAGLTVPTACEAVGVRWSTAKHWAEKGRKGLVPWVEFVDVVRKAKAMHEAAARVAIAKAMSSDWRAAAWVAESLEKQRERERARGLRRDDEADQEKTIFMYPVPAPEGAVPDQLHALPAATNGSGHAFDQTDDEETDDGPDDFDP